MSANLDMLEVIGGIAKRVKPKSIRAPANLASTLTECGLDSLDTVLLTVYICEVFDISEEIGKSLQPETFNDIAEFVAKHQKRMPASAAEAFARVDGQ